MALHPILHNFDVHHEFQFFVKTRDLEQNGCVADEQQGPSCGICGLYCYLLC